MNPKAGSSASSRKRPAAVEEDSNIVATKKAKFYSSFLKQEWSLPDPIIDCIIKNPSSGKVYQKMAMSCKYIFIKNPILVVPALNYTKVEKFDGQWRFSYNGKEINLDKLTSKLWITDNFTVIAQKNASINPMLISSLVPKIYKCDAENLSFTDQVISYNDFQLLSSAVKGVHFCRVTVKNDDGSIVPLEKILETCTKLNRITFRCVTDIPSITSKTFNELVTIPHFTGLHYVSLKNIPESFDIESFNTYIKKTEQTFFELFFDGHISEGYKNRLEKVMDEIIQSFDDENITYITPYIYYSELEQKSTQLAMYCYRPVNLCRGRA